MYITKYTTFNTKTLATNTKLSKVIFTKLCNTALFYTLIIFLLINFITTLRICFYQSSLTSLPLPLYYQK